MLTAVVPVLNDDVSLQHLLGVLSDQQIPAIVVDGSASAPTQSLVHAPHTYLQAPASRGGQIAAGIAQTSTPWVWVLHADSQPSDACFNWLRTQLKLDVLQWGRFDIDIPGVPLVGWFMNWRSRLSQICTGDQGMFFHAELLRQIGGYPVQPLMEDIEISKRLKQQARSSFCAPKTRITTSPRRWQRDGWWATVMTMWRFRWRYYRGVSAEDLFAQYYRKSL